ncbi:protein phosphatase 2C domain-containing protein (plasmid) [Deinococcus sp. KNUC1210]|uniref:PP2C family serine/threonine-protein phosphatase n=1 Tax=Deinococcus sp. KNUC1210 TaxID=2917691 RepID=UPI001EF06253|nr:PP2C family serine/threonine-protein phosphatase [Deinococcus sp. KNUC1210]ULH17300.1 protein phosphatase 2C domain-containing protein [Deinococcus sp. KNUC1210]
MRDRWRVVGASVRGTAHVQSGTECQDASLWRLVHSVQGVPVLLLTASDGAGSAAHSAEGAQLVCAALLDELERLTRHDGFALEGLDAHALLAGLRAALERQATEQGYLLRDLACTLLAGVVVPGAAWFMQVGDGAIVMQDESDLRLHVWPDSGEYANQTYFVTDVPQGHVHEAVYSGDWRRVALLTDGLQGLALSNAGRAPHAPFFEPVFRTLELAQDGWPEYLGSGLKQFLDSPAVNARTSDDKTLLLACALDVPEIGSDAPVMPDHQDADLRTEAGPPA